MGEEDLLALLIGALSVLPLLATTALRLRRRLHSAAWQRAINRSAVEEKLAVLQESWPDARLEVDGQRWKLELAPANVSLEGGFGGERCVGRGRFQLPDGPVFTVRPESFSDSVRKEYGKVDLPLGSADFDAHFMVSTSTPASTRLVWTPRAQTLMVQRFPDDLLASDGSELILERRRRPVVDCLKDADSMVALLVELLSADLFGCQALRALHGAQEAPGSEAPRVQLSIGGGEVWLGPRLLGGRARTCVWADRPAVVRLETWLARAAPPCRSLAEALGSEALERSERTTALWFPGVERDPPRLLAAAELVAALTRSDLGPYR